MVGYPVRRELLQLDRAAARKRLGIDPGRPVLLVVGGSQGAREINRAVVEALPRLRQRPDLFILHVTGATPPGGASEATYDPVADTGKRLRESGLAGDTSDWYRRLPYAEQIEDLYAVSDVVVCRGGRGNPHRNRGMRTACRHHPVVDCRGRSPGDKRP